MKYCLYALVHDASIQKYKVVVQDERVRHNRCCYAFTLGHSSSWRKLPMSGQYDHISSASVSANGKLHRLAGCYYTQGSSNGSSDFTAYEYNRSYLYSMDIATEEFMQTPTPLPHPYLSFRLLELNGSLYYLVPFMDGKVDIWVLKNWETMVWNKEHVIRPDFDLSFYSSAFAVMGETRHSKLRRLIIQDDRDLVLYELEYGEVRRILDKPKGLVSVFSHVGFLHIVHVNSLVNWH
ncbi:hypothetical protein L1049_011216 [Liquidambar formosana]|uniref:F-box associated beta-propeller type 3 domain-containing protein n=1 Tax=Liquidambar formosana TaxID=63359 RepID=A0AAP0RRI1_LIQFO